MLDFIISILLLPFMLVIKLTLAIVFFIVGCFIDLYNWVYDD